MCSTMTTNQNGKLDEVLRLLMLSDHNIPLTTYLDILLSGIAKNISSGYPVNSEGINKSSLQKWVLEALESWTAGRTPCQAVIVFTLKLVGLMGSNEIDFLFWYCADIFTKLRAIFGLEDSDLQASVRMAYTGMLTEFLNHNSGRQWIRESGLWMEVIKFCHTNHTLYETRESQEFVWKLLLLEADDEEFCGEVISIAAEPLIKNTLNPQPHFMLEDNDSDQNKLPLNVIDLLTVILENTLFASMDNTIPRLLESLTNLERRIKRLFEACIGTQFLEHSMKLMYLLVLVRFKDSINNSNGRIEPEVYNNFCMDLRYISSMLSVKKCILELAKGEKLLLTYWKKINTLCKIELPDQFKLEDQCLIVMLMPLSSCVPDQYMEEEVFQLLIQKLFSLTCTYTQRLCYKVRDTLRKEDIPVDMIIETCIQSAMDILDIVDRDSAVIIFQTMYHLLRNLVMYSSNQSAKSVGEVEKSICINPHIQKMYSSDSIVQFPNLTSVLLDSLSTIIKKFNLKWLECLEAVSILYLAQNILSHPMVIAKLCNQALSLCKLLIQNFMAPNLALLMQPDSRANEMGPVLYKRMHDSNWEVRDSVLEVINTIATISEDKYPAFQDLLLENGFPQIIVNVAATDEESKVRATALICTATLVRIHRIWNEGLHHLDIPKIAIISITNDNEVVVRKEAVKLVKELYVHRKWPNLVKEDMVKAMSAAAVSDLHWEVKVYALEFWGHFIETQFSDQGMLDGTFPTVTFSKEHRKIVSLNSAEIRKRILKALDELAKQNCLEVLLATLEDDSDFEVCKASADIIKKVQNICVKYKVSAPVVEFPRLGKMTVSDFSSICIKESSVSNHTERLESEILQPPIPANVNDSITDDTNLLSSIVERTLNMKSNSESKGCEKRECIPQRDSNQFLRFILHCDIDTHVAQKRHLLKIYSDTSDSFGSVLEDILSAYARNNINDMDRNRRVNHS